jgi:uncharacterized protein YndB with AHSA1/START domain
MEPRTIARTVRIDAATGAVWDALRSADGLSGWLAEQVDVDVAPGAAGRLVDWSGAERSVVVTDVRDGEHLGFTWWDDAAPHDASTVRIAIEQDGDGTRVTVTETVDPAAAPATGGIGGATGRLADARVADLGADAADPWAHRLGRLAARVGAVAVAVAGA